MVDFDRIENVETRDRNAARLVVIDPEGRILLLQYRDERGVWWCTPGGGVQDGESFEEAAVREAREELGLTGFPMRALWAQVREFVLKGIHYRQDEHFFLIRAGAAEIVVEGDVAVEHAAEGILGLRWWTREELGTSGDRVFPEDLRVRVEGIARSAI